MRKLPGLDVGGRSLRARGLYRVCFESRYLAPGHDLGALTRLILWNMFSWRTKLEDCPCPSASAKSVRASSAAENENGVCLTLLCLKCEPRIVRLNSPTLETTKLEGKSCGKTPKEGSDWGQIPRPELSPGNELRGFWVVDHPAHTSCTSALDRTPPRV